MSLNDKEALLARLPEVCALIQVSEHSDWHNDDVLQQSLRLVEFVAGLSVSLLGAIGSPETSLHTELLHIVDGAHGIYTAQDLLTFAALIHDVGKAETYQLQPDGTTRCLGHEAVSALLAPTLCARFDFTPQETDFIVRLVTGHGEPYALFKRIVALTELEREEHLRRFEEDWGDDLLFLLLLAYGDLVTSHLASRRPEKHQAILSFYQAWLQKALSHPSSRPPNAQG